MSKPISYFKKTNAILTFNTVFTTSIFFLYRHVFIIYNGHCTTAQDERNPAYQTHYRCGTVLLAHWPRCLGVGSCAHIPSYKLHRYNYTDGLASDSEVRNDLHGHHRGNRRRRTTLAQSTTGKAHRRDPDYFSRTEMSAPGIEPGALGRETAVLPLCHCGPK